VRLRNTAQQGSADLVVRLSQVDVNVPLEPAVFQVDVPDDATPISIEELRRAGPLGASREPSSDTAADRAAPGHQ
jgi:hypothetical protein